MGASLDQCLFSPRKSKGDCAKEIGADMKPGAVVGGASRKEGTAGISESS